MWRAVRELIAVSVVGALIVTNISPSRADSTPCDDVLERATVFHDDSISVTTSSSSRERYCHFSINGFVADDAAPPDFGRRTMLPTNREFIQALAGGDLVRELTHRLFIADSEINMDTVEEAYAFLKENGEEVATCFADFRLGKEGISYSAESPQFTMLCEDVERDNLRLMLEEHEVEIVRAAFFSR